MEIWTRVLPARARDHLGAAIRLSFAESYPLTVRRGNGSDLARVRGIDTRTLPRRNIKRPRILGGIHFTEEQHAPIGGHAGRMLVYRTAKQGIDARAVDGCSRQVIGGCFERMKERLAIRCPDG